MKRKQGFYEKYIKRPLDFFIALLVLIIFFPIFLIISILIKFKLGSPVIFKQKRVGLNSKTFMLYKFRTMTNEKDEFGKLLPDNLRLTKFGRFLRKTSIDEIPELLNILNGDMSIVGPRPLLEEYIPYYTKEEIKRHDVRPGLTGLSQVNGRSYLSWEERFELDKFYVENCNLCLDINIIFKTISNVIRKKNVVDIAEVKVDKIGEYFEYNGKIFRRLDEERCIKK